MGFFSGLKKAVKGVGKIAKYAAPILAATGVGAPLAIGIGAAGGLMQGGNVKDMLKNATVGAGGAALAGGLGGGTLGKIGQFAKSGLGGMLKGQDGRFDLSDIGRIGQYALPALTGIQAYGASKQAGRDTARSRELTEGAISATRGEADRAQAAWMANQGLRDSFRNAAMNFFDPTNPFARNLAAAPASALPGTSSGGPGTPPTRQAKPRGGKTGGGRKISDFAKQRPPEDE
jgi:hypothetical protein